MDKLNKFFVQNNWKVIYSYEEAEKAGEYENYSNLGLSDCSLNLLAHLENGVYKHQAVAINKFIHGENICLSTSTSSGKTLVFHISALEILKKNPQKKIIATYPILALAREQESRWKEAVKQSGLAVQVGRIDGSISKDEREKILITSSIIIMTPDVMHAWLMRDLDTVRMNFIRNISLIIIDEAHTYTGVFGSNSAFLYRRLQQAIMMLDSSCQFIAGSATILDPVDHLEKLTGLKFSIIGNDQDASPKRKKTIILVDTNKNFQVAKFLRFCKSSTKHRFIAFVDNRKKVESLAQESDEIKLDKHTIDEDFLKDSKISPYRSGYESRDQKRIMDYLRNGKLKGVVSTSAIEMGIDIPGISLGILVGIPPSATSFYQRIGRVGRHSDGVIVIINDGSDYSSTIFKQPEKIKNLPLLRSSIYLENDRIRYAHAQCLVGKLGENTAIQFNLGLPNPAFVPKASFPSSFIGLCQRIIKGDSLKELQGIKLNSKKSPHLTFPLRNLGDTYTVNRLSSPTIMDQNLGSLTSQQVIREAYPGAIYYHQKRPFRVLKINDVTKEIIVETEKNQITIPNLNRIIKPYLSEKNHFKTIKSGDIEITECRLFVSELVYGYKQIYSKNKQVNIEYPLKGKHAFNKPYYSHSFFSSGVLISHPLFNSIKISLDRISKIIYEAFLMVMPFDRNDIGFSCDFFHQFPDKGFFVVIYDNLYDGLRLTEKLMDFDIFQATMRNAINIIKGDEHYFENAGKYENKWLKKLETDSNRKKIKKYSNENHKIYNNIIILPKSKGVNIQGDINKEFYVEDIVYLEQYGVCYKGIYLPENQSKNVSIFLPIDYLVEIPNESKFGLYEYKDSEVIITNDPSINN